MRVFLAVAGLTALLSCGSDILGPYEDEGPDAAWIIYGGHGPGLEVPDSAAAGTQVVIRFNTYSGGCIKTGSIDVHRSTTSFDIVPINNYHRADGCPDILIEAFRQVTITPSKAGRYTINLRGTRVINLPQRARERATVTRELVVY